MLRRRQMRHLASVRDIMSDVFDVDLEHDNLTPETTANDLKEWNNLSHIRLMDAIERKIPREIHER